MSVTNATTVSVQLGVVDNATAPIAQLKVNIQSLGATKATVTVDANTAAAKLAIQQLDAQTRALNAKVQMIKVQADTSEAAQGIRAVDAQARLLTAQARMMKLQADSSTATTVMKKLETDANALTSKPHVVRFQADTTQATASLNGLHGGITAVRAAAEAMHGDILGAVQGAAMFGPEAAALAGFAAAMSTSVEAAGALQQQMANLGAVSHFTSGELASVAANTQQLARDTIFTAAQIAESEVAIAKSGADAAGTMREAADAANLASAANASLNDATRSLITAQKDFGLAASDSTRIADTLAQGVDSGVMSLNQLQDGFKQVGPVAAQAGMSIEQTRTALVTLGNAGLSGDSGNSLKIFLQRLEAPTAKSRADLKGLGIDAYDAAGNMKPLADIADQLHAKLSGLDAETRNQKLTEIFGARGVRAADVFVSEGSSGLNQTDAQAAKVGTAAEVATAKLNTLEGQTKQLKSSLSGLAATFGAELVPQVQQSVTGLGELVNAMNKAIASTPAVSGQKAYAKGITDSMGVTGTDFDQNIAVASANIQRLTKMRDDMQKSMHDAPNIAGVALFPDATNTPEHLAAINAELQKQNDLVKTLNTQQLDAPVKGATALAEGISKAVSAEDAANKRAGDTYTQVDQHANDARVKVDGLRQAFIDSGHSSQEFDDLERQAFKNIQANAEQAYAAIDLQAEQTRKKAEDAAHYSALGAPQSVIQIAIYGGDNGKTKDEIKAADAVLKTFDKSLQDTKKDFSELGTYANALESSLGKMDTSKGFTGIAAALPSLQNAQLTLAKAGQDSALLDHAVALAKDFDAVQQRIDAMSASYRGFENELDGSMNLTGKIEQQINKLSKAYEQAEYASRQGTATPAQLEFMSRAPGMIQELQKQEGKIYGNAATDIIGMANTKYDFATQDDMTRNAITAQGGAGVMQVQTEADRQSAVDIATKLKSDLAKDDYAINVTANPDLVKLKADVEKMTPPDLVVNLVPSTPESASVGTYGYGEGTGPTTPHKYAGGAVSGNLAVVGDNPGGGVNATSEVVDFANRRVYSNAQSRTLGLFGKDMPHYAEGTGAAFNRYTAISWDEYKRIVQSGTMGDKPSPMLTQANWHALDSAAQAAHLDPRWMLATALAEGHMGTDPGLAAASANNFGGEKWAGQAGATDSGIQSGEGDNYAGFPDLGTYFQQMGKTWNNSIIGPATRSGDAYAAANLYTRPNASITNAGRDKVSAYNGYVAAMPPQSSGEAVPTTTATSGTTGAYGYGEGNNTASNSPPAPATVPGGNDLAKQMAENANKYLGQTAQSTGEAWAGWCEKFVGDVQQQTTGLNYRPSSANQHIRDAQAGVKNAGTIVDAAHAQAGDFVAFAAHDGDGSGGNGHIGINEGGGKYTSALSGGITTKDIPPGAIFIRPDGIPQMAGAASDAPPLATAPPIVATDPQDGGQSSGTFNGTGTGQPIPVVVTGTPPVASIAADPRDGGQSSGTFNGPQAPPPAPPPPPPPGTNNASLFNGPQATQQTIQGEGYAGRGVGVAGGAAMLQSASLIGTAEQSMKPEGVALVNKEYERMLKLNQQIELAKLPPNATPPQTEAAKADAMAKTLAYTQAYAVAVADAEKPNQDLTKDIQAVTAAGGANAQNAQATLVAYQNLAAAQTVRDGKKDLLASNATDHADVVQGRVKTDAEDAAKLKTQTRGAEDLKVAASRRAEDEKRDLTHSRQLAEQKFNEETKGVERAHASQERRWADNEKGVDRAHASSERLYVDNEKATDRAHTSEDRRWSDHEKSIDRAHTSQERLYGDNEKSIDRAHASQERLYTDHEKSIDRAHTVADRLWSDNEKAIDRAHSSQERLYSDNEKNIDRAHTAADRAWSDNEKAVDRAHTASERLYSDTEKSIDRANASANRAWSDNEKATDRAHTSSERLYSDTEKAVDRAHVAQERAWSDNEKATDRAHASSERLYSDTEKSIDRAHTASERLYSDTEKSIDRAHASSERLYRDNEKAIDRQQQMLVRQEAAATRVAAAAKKERDEGWRVQGEQHTDQVRGLDAVWTIRQRQIQDETRAANFLAQMHSQDLADQLKSVDKLITEKGKYNSAQEQFLAAQAAGASTNAQAQMYGEQLALQKQGDRQAADALTVQKDQIQAAIDKEQDLAARQKYDAETQLLTETRAHDDQMKAINDAWLLQTRAHEATARGIQDQLEAIALANADQRQAFDDAKVARQDAHDAEVRNFDDAKIARQDAHDQEVRLWSDAKIARQDAHDQEVRLWDDAKIARQDAHDQEVRLWDDAKIARQDAHDMEVRNWGDAKIARQDAHDTDVRNFDDAKIRRQDAHDQEVRLWGDAKIARQDAHDADIRNFDDVKIHRQDAHDQEVRAFSDAKIARQDAHDAETRLWNDAKIARQDAHDQEVRNFSDAKIGRQDAHDQEVRNFSDAKIGRQDAHDTDIRNWDDAKIRRQDAHENAVRQWSNEKQQRQDLHDAETLHYQDEREKRQIAHDTFLQHLTAEDYQKETAIIDQKRAEDDLATKQARDAQDTKDQLTEKRRQEDADFAAGQANLTAQIKDDDARIVRLSTQAKDAETADMWIGRATSALTAAGQSVATTLSQIPTTPKVPGHAAGTNSAARGLAVVGENGPELVQMAGGERVYPNDQTRRMLSGALTPISAAPSYVNNSQYHITVVQQPGQSTDELMAALTQMLDAREHANAQAASLSAFGSARNVA